MAVTVPARRNSSGEVSIAGTIPIDPTGKTLPVGAVDNGDGTCSLMTAGGGAGGATDVIVTGPLGPQTAAASVATVPAFRSPASSDVSVAATAGGTQIVAANATGQLVSISNNGLTPIWIDYGGTNPVADGATASGIGRGIMLASGGLWESPTPITTAVKGIAQSGQTCSVRATVS